MIWYLNDWFFTNIKNYILSNFYHKQANFFPYQYWFGLNKVSYLHACSGSLEIVTAIYFISQMNKVLSSANNVYMEDDAFIISSMKIQKRRGPRQETCGIPWVILSMVHCIMFRVTLLAVGRVLSEPVLSTSSYSIGP